MTRSKGDSLLRGKPGLQSTSLSAKITQTILASFGTKEASKASGHWSHWWREASFFDTAVRDGAENLANNASRA